MPLKHMILIIIAVFAALALRIPHLALRPMHCDEAVHAVKFGELLEKGQYQYDPFEYHGPTLNYLTLPLIRMMGVNTIEQVTESMLRFVVVICSMVTILLTLFFFRKLPFQMLWIVMLFTGLSPAMVFYSRYYIQETLLVCFTFGLIVFGFRYYLKPSAIWILLAGICAGLMHATKETCIISWFAMMSSACILCLFHWKQKRRLPTFINHLKISHGLLLILSAGCVSVVFYSSFFTHPRGIIDSFLTFSTYLNRSHHSVHLHSWDYYFRMLLFAKYFDGPVWSEALIVLAAAGGFIVAIFNRTNTKEGLFFKWIALYTLIMGVIYSAIPYKTPWSMLGFLHGMVLLASVFISHIMIHQKKKVTRILITAVLLFGSIHLGWQSYLANTAYSSDPRNPYVYSHPTIDVYTMVHDIKKLIGQYPVKQELTISVISSNSDYWPLPWYLRAFPGIGWYNEFDKTLISSAVIITHESELNTVINDLYKNSPSGEKYLYLPFFDQGVRLLRPGKPMAAIIRKDIWDQWQHALNLQNEAEK